MAPFTVLSLASTCQLAHEHDKPCCDQAKQSLQNIVIHNAVLQRHAFVSTQLYHPDQ
jgi:hypothetical protein